MSALFSCVVTAGSSATRAWDITQADAGARRSIGSDATATWQFGPGEVQPKHAELYFDGAQIYICDLMNQGDVLVSGRPVAAGQWIAVPPGTDLAVGHARMHVQAGGAPASFSAPPPPNPDGGNSKGKAKSQRKSRRPPGPSGNAPRTIAMGAAVALLVVCGVGFMVYKKFLSTPHNPAPLRSAAAQLTPRTQTAEHLFPSNAASVHRERDSDIKRTNPIKPKENAKEPSTKLERPEPTTLEGKAAAAAIDGDLDEARKLYGELLKTNPSSKTFRVALDIVDQKNRARCLERGDTSCD